MSSELDEETRASAAHWFTVLRRGPMTTAERAAYNAWRAEPRNQRALDHMQNLWGELAGLKTMPRPAARPKAFWRTAGAAAAAAVFLSLGALGGVSLWSSQGAGEAVVTSIGEQRSQRLPDGSVITLNVATSLSYRMRPNERAIRLDDGQALFVVQKDADRPFVVRTGNYEVRALGTAFDVRRRDDQVDVAVSEGVVSVRTVRGPDRGGELVRLVAGQRLRVSTVNRGEPAAVHGAPIDTIALWRMHVLHYEDATVASIAADLSRFYARPVYVRESNLAERRVTLRLEVSQREQALRTLSQLLGARIEQGAESDVLTTAGSGP